MTNREKEDVSWIWYALVVVGAPLTLLLRAFVLCRLWAWFVVPLGVTSIGMAHAYGLTIIVGMLREYRSQSGDEKRDTPTVVLTSLLTGIFVPLLAWAIGAAVHAWWM